MIWGLFLTLGHNMWVKESKELTFSENAWQTVTADAAEKGINTIILDLGEGVKWPSHPELSCRGAWSREKIKSEVIRLRDMGIALIPKLNFSACHDLWLGQYRFEYTKPVYYQVVRDLIRDAYDLFLCPEYIHLGMDEEGDLTHQICYTDYIKYRKGELLWHDLNYLIDCVKELGAKAWIWSDFAATEFKQFSENISTDDVVVSPWYYFALKPEHFRELIPGTDDYINNQRYPYNFMNLKYSEDNPLLKLMRESFKPLADAGYDAVPCTSNCYKCPYNTEDLFEYYIENVDMTKVKGFMTAPWNHTTDASVDSMLYNIKLLTDAKKKYFPNEK